MLALRIIGLLMRGSPRDWIKEIQDEINYLRMKGIDIDEMFLVLVKIMKKVKLKVGLTDMDLNWRARLKISSHWWARGEDCWVHKAHGPAHIWVCIFIPWSTSILSSSGF